MTTKNVTFTSRLREFAKISGLKQQEMADRLGISRENYAKFSDNPTYDKVMSILNAFPELSAEWLMRGTGSMLMADNDAPVVAKDNDNALVALLKDENDFLRMQNQKLTDRLLG